LGAVVPVSESHPALFEAFDPTVGDGNAKHVASQIVQDLLALAGVLAMNDPVLLPHCGGDLPEQAEFFESGPEFAAKDFTQGKAWNQEGGMARRHPMLPVLGQAAGAEQAMPAPTALRAKRIGSRPRLVQVCKMASIARRPPTYVGSQASFCNAAAALQQTVKGLLLAVGQGADRCGQGEGQQIIGARQESSPLMAEPTLGLFSVTLWTMPVPAGMITVVFLATVITAIELAATGGGATAHQVLQYLLLTGQKPVCLSIGRAVEAEDVRHLDHERGA